MGLDTDIIKYVSVKAKRKERDRDSRFDALGFDSLDMVEMIGDIEENYKLRFSDLDVQKMNNVGDIIDYVSSRYEKKE